MGLRHRDTPGLGAAASELAENVADRDRSHLRARHAGDLEQGHAAAPRLHLDLDLLVVELAGTQPLAERLFGGSAGILPDQCAHDPFLGGELGARLHVLALPFPRLRDRNLHQVAHDLLDIAADIADLGEFGRLDLEEGGAGHPGEPARNLGFPDAGRSDHQNVFRQHLFAHLLVELQAPPTVAKRDRDCALGIGLSDNEAIELGDDLAG